MACRWMILALVAAMVTPVDAVPVPALVAAARARTSIVIDGGAFGPVPVSLRESEVLVPGAPITLDGEAFVYEPFWTLTGSVTGVADSAVALTVTAHDFAGLIRVGERTAWLDPWGPPAIDAGPDADRLAVIDAPLHHGAVSVNAGVGTCSIQACGTLTAYVMLDSDASFTAEDPATCPARQVATLTTVAAIYDDVPTDISLRAAGTNCSTVTHGSTFDEAFLIALTDAWRGVGPSRSTLLHAVGADPDGSAIGIAYQPGVCARMEPNPGSQRCEYGMAAYQTAASTGSYTGSLAHRAKVAAHELGHSFNGHHDHGADCATPSGTLMCPFFKPSGPDAFSSANAARIRSHAEATIGWLACAVGQDGQVLSDC